MSLPYSGKNYRYIKIPNHPLANIRGMVRYHRAVLYEKIGPGSHPCHWCGRAVEWTVQIRGLKPGMLVADHLDEDITNNDPRNLVPACGGCNGLRKRGWRIQDGELFVIDERGDRIRAAKEVCGNCGIEFITRPRNRNKTGMRFCSLHCAGVYTGFKKNMREA
jgi:hypothetical protein